MDKPAVARKIVKAIRHGNPPGRFLRKGDDGRWYDVGDRTAAEKTSQGLRERTNAEKRQRSAVRESLRMQKHESVEDIENPSKKAKGNDTRIVSETISPLPKTPAGSDIPAPGFVRVKAEGDKVGARKKAEGKDEKVAAPTAEWSTEGLPPNAVDSHGNILVTDYDILVSRSEFDPFSTRHEYLIVIVVLLHSVEGEVLPTITKETNAFVT